MKSGFSIFHRIHGKTPVKCGKLTATKPCQSQEVGVCDSCGG